MPTRIQICTEALQWLGCPYHHQASLKGVACDCVGFVAGVARAVGSVPATFRFPPYSPEWHIHRHEDLLCQTLHVLGATPVALAEVQGGDILAYQFGKVISHLAIALGDGTMIHAARDHRKVVQHHLSGDWAQRLRRAYAFPGVEEG